MSRHSTIIQWSENDQAFIATVPELPGLSAFGDTPEKAVKELSAAKKLYLEVLNRDGDVMPEPDILKPFSGQMRLRLPKSLHASLSQEAKKEGVSLNTYIIKLLAEKNALASVRKEIEKVEHELRADKSQNRPSWKTGEPSEETLTLVHSDAWAKDERSVAGGIYRIN